MKKKKPPQIQVGKLFRYSSPEQAIKDLKRVEKKQQIERSNQMAMKVMARCQGCGQEFVAPPHPDSEMWLSKERGEYKCFKCDGTVKILKDESDAANVKAS